MVPNDLALKHSPETPVCPPNTGKAEFLPFHLHLNGSVHFFKSEDLPLEFQVVPI